MSPLSRSCLEAMMQDEWLAARWAELEYLPTNSLGRRIWEMYMTRGFIFPGKPGAAPALLAQHDWVHVLADYGTTLEGELEVFSFIAHASNDKRDFALLNAVISLFETGRLKQAAGLFMADPGHMRNGPHMVERCSDAIRRGILCQSVHFMRVNWFDLAPNHVEEVRERFKIPRKTPTVDSPGLDHPDGISEFQRRAGQDTAHLVNKPPRKPPEIAVRVIRIRRSRRAS